MGLFSSKGRDHDEWISKADRRATSKSPRSSKQRAEAAEAGKDKNRSYSSLKHESHRKANGR